MKKNKIIILLISFLFFLPFSVSALSSSYEDHLNETLSVPKDEEKVNIYFFYAKGCPHCAKEEEFLNLLDERYKGKYNLYSFETGHNDKNYKLMLKAKEKMGVSVNNGVPFTVIGNDVFQGYDDSTGEKIEIRIKRYLDIITEEESLVNKYKEDIPLLGEIDKKDVSIGLVAIVLGLVDGFNPCAMWILLFLINMLLGMKDKKKMLILGCTFLFVSAFMYFLFMLGITSILSFLSTRIIRRIIGVVAITIGAFNIYKFIRDRKKEVGCVVVDETKRKKIFTRIKKFTREKNIFIALIGVVILAISVNAVELACSSVFPATFAEILAVNNVGGIARVIYLIIYTIFYMIDDLIVFVVAVATLELSTSSAKYGKYSKVISGLIMLIVGLLLIFKPEWLMLNF